MPSHVDIESTLSDREKDIVRLSAWGYIQKEIADVLNISPRTVSTHLNNIYQKLNIRKITDLCRMWIFHEYGIDNHDVFELKLTAEI